MKITIKIVDTGFEARITALSEKIGNLTPVMHEIGQRYERRVLENFEREQAPDGTPWMPNKVISNHLSYLLSNSGKKKRQTHTAAGQLTAKFARFLANKKILQLTGRMRSRVHYQADATSVQIGVSGIAYGAIHQFGGMAGRSRKVKIPARPYLAMTAGNKMVLAQKDKDLVMEVLRKHLTG